MLFLRDERNLPVNRGSAPRRRASPRAIKGGAVRAADDATRKARRVTRHQLTRLSEHQTRISTGEDGNTHPAVAGGRLTESSGGVPRYGSISTRVSWPVQPWLKVEEGRSAVSTFGLP